MGTVRNSTNKLIPSPEDRFYVVDMSKPEGEGDAYIEFVDIAKANSLSATNTTPGTIILARDLAGSSTAPNC